MQDWNITITSLIVFFKIHPNHPRCLGMLIYGALVVGRLTKNPPPNHPQPPHFYSTNTFPKNFLNLLTTIKPPTSGYLMTRRFT
jgi:hypothetical protein